MMYTWWNIVNKFHFWRGQKTYERIHESELGPILSNQSVAIENKQYVEDITFILFLFFILQCIWWTNETWGLTSLALGIVLSWCEIVNDGVILSIRLCKILFNFYFSFLKSLMRKKRSGIAIHSAEAEHLIISDRYEFWWKLSFPGTGKSSITDWLSSIQNNCLFLS